MSVERPLVLRSNRFFGSALTERGLLKPDELEAANERLLETIQTAELHQANLLNILLLDLKCLDESRLIESQIDEFDLGAIDLSSYNLQRAAELNSDIDLCRATYSLPFDRVEDFIMVASAFFLSKPAIQYWEEQLQGNVIWYVATVGSIAEALERLAALQSSAPAEADS